MIHQVHIYTDGAAKGNPGNGGYGVVMELVGTNYKKEFYEGFRHTTNNRMELLAVIVGLEKITKPNMKFLVGRKKGLKTRRIQIYGCVSSKFTTNIKSISNG